jgi:pSer/pThr/pTyr-binding forkhead associated (FHA) protein
VSQIRVLFKGNQIKVVPLTEEETVIGSADDCAIYIDTLAIQPYHALILKKEDSILVRAIQAENPIIFSGEEVIEQLINDSESFYIGKHSFQFEVGNESAREPVAEVEPIFKTEKESVAWLQILNGPNLGKTINLHRKMTNIGKKGAQHEIIAHRSGGYFLTHLEGSEIPRVNGKEIGDATHQLNSNDIIEIGKIKLMFTVS